MRIYGLTGGTGSGKSEAGRRFAERGIPVIDADAVGHELLEPGGVAVGPVVQAFGEDILADGGIDRSKLGALVFADGAARKKLTAIIHPLIYKEIAVRCADLAEQGYDAVLIDAALLAEDGKRNEWLDGLILVTCPREIRLRRLTAKRGLTPELAEQRIASQYPPEHKLALADWVIDNGGTLRQLREQVDRVAETISADGGGHTRP